MTVFNSNPTQALGVTAFAVAAAACFLAAALDKILIKKHGANRDALVPKVWLSLGFIHCLFALEVIVGGRHSLHNYASILLKSGGMYPDRFNLQLPLLIVVAAVTLLIIVAMIALIIVLLAKAARSKLIATIACIASLTVLFLFVVEVVSLHDIDAIMYTPYRSVLLVGWLWLALALVVAGSALLHIRQFTRLAAKHPV